MATRAQSSKRARAASTCDRCTLQEDLLAKLVEEASTPPLDEVLERAGDRAGGSLSFRDAVKAAHDGRDRR